MDRYMYDKEIKCPNTLGILVYDCLYIAPDGVVVGGGGGGEVITYFSMKRYVVGTH